ncbi:HAMP domain-containing histidine kinase [Streptomyces sp. NBC_01808]|uniref:sensor histidine kinase n=1 Tax=Streptomyces sp. NBC_01808 TaxID=2975947 RepID=UPI002DDB65BE|nr:HAMP domain-containing sensor histidine kinase [Streptomyces sp. NBC_01808]WSA38578.1 HAMP domain-containing histidine kinase [Streptomyces sp. NBC_01808]
MTSRFGRLPLRSRLALLTAAAVAVAVTACAVTAWFLVRSQLLSSLDDELNKTQPAARIQIDNGRLQCLQSVPDDTGPFTPSGPTVQLVLEDGQRCYQNGEQLVKVQGQDTRVAGGELDWAAHNTTADDGTEYRVLTRPAPQIPGVAYTVGRPLSEVTDPLDTLALVLTLLAAGGVVASGVAGVALARAGLRPVERLTHTVEHIARTEDLAVEIPVEGDDEIARLSRSFNAMTAALATSQERQQQLIADAGHELRTPLTSLRTNIELLARSEESGRELPPRQRRELLESVTAQMTELAALIGDLQELSRPDAAPDKAQLEVVALDEIAERAVRRVRLRAPEVRIDAELAPWFVRAEPAALERAVVNLLDNAVKFSPAGSRVEVGLGGDGLLRVRDHGPGIPEAELPHVFERFWRSPSARSRPGSGLGLSIVARTVQQAGGTVELRRAAGGGTEALLRLPGAPEPPPGSSAAIRGRGPDRSA